MTQKDLTRGSPLIVEDLDLSDLGLYLSKDPNVPEHDYVDSGYLSLGRTLYKRRSEEGIKWSIFKETK